MAGEPGQRVWGPVEPPGEGKPSGEGELPDADRVSYQTAFPKEGACKHPAPPCHLPSCCSIHHVPRASGAWD